MTRALLLLLFLLAAPPAARAESPAEAAWRQGLEAARENRLEEALQHFRETVRLDPGHAPAHLELAFLLEQRGLAEAALSHADRALRLDPADAWSLPTMNLFRSRALLLRGRLLSRLQRPGASEAWQAAPDTAPPEFLDPWFALAREALDRGDLEAGAVWTQAAVEASIVPTRVPSDVTVWGPGYLRVDLPGGGVAWTRSLRLGVDRQWNLHRVGGGSLGLRLPDGSYGMTVGRDGSVNVYKEDSLRESGGDSAVPSRIGRLPVFLVDPATLKPGPGGLLVSSQAHPQEAPLGPTEISEIMVGFRQATPHDGGAFERLVAASEDAAWLVRALPFATRSDAVAVLARLQDGPLEPLARARLGALYFVSFQAARRPEDLHEARAQWNELRTLRPDLQFVAVNLASAALLDHRFDEAAAHLDGLAREHPQRELPRRLLVQLAMALRRWDEALAAADDLARAFPHHPFPGYARAEILARQDRRTEALAVLDALLAEHPLLVEPRFLKARLLGRSGDIRGQRQELELLLEMDPTHVAARTLLADLLDRLGEHERAKQVRGE